MLSETYLPLETWWETAFNFIEIILSSLRKKKITSILQKLFLIRQVSYKNKIKIILINMKTLFTYNILDVAQSSLSISLYILVSF